MKEDVTAIVISCDKYEDTWYPFFKLLKDYWEDFNLRILFATETKSFSFDGLDIEVVNSRSEFWSNRVIEVLKKVKTKYVLFFLDDFFINGKVNVKEIENCLSALKNDKSISSFSFGDSLLLDRSDDRFNTFDLRFNNQEYIYNTQCALWRRKDLLKIYRKGENPWQAENNGTFRTFVLMKKKKFYTVKHGLKSPVPYEYGGAIHRGMWTVDTPKLLAEHGITDIDFSIRGFDPKPTSEWTRFRGESKLFDYPKGIKKKTVNYLNAKGSILYKIYLKFRGER